MAKHGRSNDVTATRGNPVLRMLRNAEIVTDESRLAKDVEIIDKGWNNTEEGQTDLLTDGASRSGKHAR